MFFRVSFSASILSSLFFFGFARFLSIFFVFGSGHYLLFVGCRWQRLNLPGSSVSSETGTRLRVRVVSHLSIEMLQIDFRCRLGHAKKDLPTIAKYYK